VFSVYNALNEYLLKSDHSAPYATVSKESIRNAPKKTDCRISLHTCRGYTIFL